MTVHPKNKAKAKEITDKLNAYIKDNPKFWIRDLREHLNIKSKSPFPESYEYQTMYRVINRYKRDAIIILIDQHGLSRRYQLIKPEKL